ncbi:predicted protein [Pyrenophora tritici-repentis Pt-1C-BFP]|uniref:Uncharacterized protein n=1 Tax=Pyrenophora tritici-repentis (strain Pt-1C-BFP) TaxID=426418 RepID=B2W2B0_PYRTR|nr:uncharacterized protein PTRG_03558 [Pyrenophora tritici-repentis Pt-1C-BFP]EDU46396.1 predicted protein [Pyrenophora tritici-repentis Pt-1C-BFP]
MVPRARCGVVAGGSGAVGRRGRAEILYLSEGSVLTERPAGCWVNACYNEFKEAEAKKSLQLKSSHDGNGRKFQEPLWIFWKRVEADCWPNASGQSSNKVAVINTDTATKKPLDAPHTMI